MSNGFRNIFWGLIFVSFNFNLGFINIFPDFIGYLFIISGCAKLSEEEIAFKKVNKIGMVLVALTLIDYVRGIILPFTSESITAYSFLSILITLILGIGELYIVYHICKGIYNMASHNEVEYLMKMAKFRWNFILYIFLLNQIAIPFIYNFELPIFRWILGIFSVIQFIASILIIRLVTKAKNYWIALE